MVTGLIFVRHMPVGEYAVYALAMTAFSLISVGSDLGLNGSLGYFWRQSLAKKRPPWRYIEAVRKLRSLLFWISLAVAGALLLSSPVFRQESYFTMGTISVLLALAAWLQVRTSVNLTLLRLQGRLRESYKCEVISNAVRLSSALLLASVVTLTAGLGLFVGLLSAIALTAAIRRIVPPEAPPRERTYLNRDDWRDIRAYMLPVFPSVLVFIVQDPLIVWMTAKYAGATTVAEVFGLSRISAILGLVGTFIYIVLVPKLAQVADGARFNRLLFFFFIALAGLLACIVLFVAIAPAAPLWLLGKNYSHLEREVILGVIAASVLALGALVTLSNRVRGWVAADPVIALLHFIGLIVICLLWDYSSTISVMRLALALSVLSFAISVSTFILGVCQPALISAKVGHSTLST